MAYKPLIDSEGSKEPGLRMVLIGRTDSGKSSTGNTILRKKVFKSHIFSSSATSECQKGTGEFRDQILSVVDTPGLFDTSKSEEEVKKEIFRCISMAAPGPHVFLVVIQPGRFTEEEEATVELIQEIFGEKSSDYTMALFTHGDDLEEDELSVEYFISKNPSLCNFIKQCGGGYHVFNNRSKDSSQVKELLEKINRMNETNRGSYYTNEMLEEAKKAIRDEMEKLMRKNPQMKPEEARSKAERENEYIQYCVAASEFAGSFGAGDRDDIKFLLEAAIEAGVGLAVAGAVVAIKKKACVIQ